MVDRINIGKITLLSLTDGSAPPVDPTWPFPKVEITKWKNHFDALDHNHKHNSNFGSFIIISNDEKILVDTGLGNHTTEKLNSPPMQLEKNLLRLGIRTEEITKTNTTQEDNSSTITNLEDNSFYLTEFSDLTEGPTTTCS